MRDPLDPKPSVPAQSVPAQSVPAQSARFITGFAKTLFYARMSVGSALHFLPQVRRLGGFRKYVRLLMRAARLTRIFYVHKLLRLPDGRHKLDFYLPAYPSEAFFRTMETKLAEVPPRPATVVLSVTRACRYRCPHCYQGKDSAEEMPLERLLEVVRELREFGITAWAVEGGDPLLRFDRLLPVLQELSGSEVWVNSTGMGADPEKLAAMKAAQVVGIMSSVHFTDPLRHDAFTGVPGSWERTMDFLRDCRNAGFLTGFNTVLTDEQILDGEIDRVMDLARARQCDYIQLIHPKSCGRWLDQEFAAEKHERAKEIACAAQRRYNSARERHAPILAAQVYEESPEMLGCTCGGIDRFYVGSSGEVQPCEFLNISFGNLTREPFSTIYGRMRKVFAIPCENWPCCEKASEIARAFAENGVQTAPLPWELTEKLTENWEMGTPTKVYSDIGIYS